MLPDQSSMPTQDGLGSHQERRPVCSWHQSGQRGDERPVRPREARPADLAEQDRELMAEHEDLGILGNGVHSPRLDQFDDATGQAIEKAESQTAGSPVKSPQVKPEIRFLDPSGTSSSPGWSTTREPALHRAPHEGRPDQEGDGSLPQALRGSGGVRSAPALRIWG